MTKSLTVSNIKRSISLSYLSGCSFVRSFGRSVVRSFGRSVVRSFGRSVVRSFGRSVGRSVVRSFSLFVGSLVGWLVRSLGLLFFYLFVRSSRYSPVQTGNILRPNTIKHCLMTIHVNLELSGQTVSNRFHQRLHEQNVLQFLIKCSSTYAFQFYRTRSNKMSKRETA